MHFLGAFIRYFAYFGQNIKKKSMRIFGIIFCIHCISDSFIPNLQSHKVEFFIPFVHMNQGQMAWPIGRITDVQKPYT